MWPLKSIVLEIWSPVLRVSTQISGVSKEIDGKTLIFQSKPRHVTPQIDRLRRTKHSPDGYNTHFCHVAKEIDERNKNFSE